MTNYITAIKSDKLSIENDILSYYQGLNDEKNLKEMKELLEDIPQWSKSELQSFLEIYDPYIRRKVLAYQLLASLPITKKIQRAFRSHLMTYGRTLENVFLTTIFPDAPASEIKDAADKISKSFMENGHDGNAIICKKREVGNIRINGKEIVCITDNSDRERRKRVVSINMLLPDKKGRVRIFYFSVSMEFSWNQKHCTIISRQYQPISRFAMTLIQRAFRRHVGEYDRTLKYALLNIFPNVPDTDIKDAVDKISKSFMKNGHYGNKIICEKREVSDIKIHDMEIICFTDNTDRKHMKRVVSISLLQPPPKKGGFKTFHTASKIIFKWENKKRSVLESDEEGFLKGNKKITLRDIEQEINGARIQAELARMNPDIICEAPKLVVRSGRRIIFKQRVYKEFVDGMRNHNYTWLLNEMKRVIQGLIFIHSIGIVHRDFKAPNLFISGEDHVLIGDFGLSKRSTDICNSSGTLYFMPKLCMRNGMNPKSEQDNFAFVINLALIMFGDRLYKHLEEPDEPDDRKYLLKLIKVRELFASNASYYDGCNEVYQDLLMYPLKNKVINYLSSNMQCGPELIDKIKKSNEIYKLIEIINDRSIPDDIKHESIVMIRFFETTYKLLVDTINLEVTRGCISSTEILNRLSKIHA